MADSQDPGWERGWEGHERAQRLRLSKLPLAERVRWLEEAQRVVLALQEARAGRARGTNREAAPPE